MPRLKTFDPVAIAQVPRLARAEAERRAAVAGRGEGLEELGAGSAGRPDEALLRLLDRPDWADDPKTAAALREPLLRLSARYLLHARTTTGRALDPVAHFHLSNGARVEQLDWLGDRSPKGLQQSAGIMVNYLYRLGDIEANHEAYRDEGRVAASSAVRGLGRAA